jgi:hypothetical protein
LAGPVASWINTSGCPRAGEFLGAVSQLADRAVENPKAPGSPCYVYDAQGNTLTLERVEPIRKLDVRSIRQEAIR